MIHMTVGEILNLPAKAITSFEVIHTTDTGIVVNVVIHDADGWHTQSFYISRSSPRYYEALARAYECE